MQTAYQMVWMSAERTPDHLALIDDLSERRLTYAELIGEIDIVAAGLFERGIRQGDRVATVLPSLFEHCLLLLALQRLCAVPALINFRLSVVDIRNLISDGDITAAVILSDQVLKEEVEGALAKNGVLITVGNKIEGADEFSDCRGDPAGLSFPSPEREDPAFIFYTSGTTGLPKGVVLGHRSTEPRVIWLSTQAGLRHGTHNRALGFMPLSHSIGFYGVFLATLALNGTYYVMSAFNPKEAVEMVEKYGITYMFAVPQLYHAMFQAPNYSAEKMRSTEVVLYGGAQIDGEFLKTLDGEWAAVIRHIYGTTETMCSLYNPDPVGQHTRLRPGFYSRTRVIDIDGGVEDQVGSGQEGQLIVDATADTVFTEYLNRPDDTAESIVEGWYYTGDICIAHENGDVDLLGRVDDLIRSGGENIHPGQIEEILMSHSGIRDVAVIGIPHKKWGEAVTACIVGDDIPVEDFERLFQNSEIAQFKRPRIYMFLEIIPRNATNKILRRELKANVLRSRTEETNYKIVEV